MLSSGKHDVTLSPHCMIWKAGLALKLAGAELGCEMGALIEGL